jgi:poly [ADP-ribose] polymerase 2/3/4
MKYLVQGMRTVKLICVTSDNNNKYYNMYEQSNNTFVAQYGRIKGSEVTHTYPISDWNKIYKSKIKKGYVEVTHLFTEEVEKEIQNANGDVNKIAEIQNQLVKKLIEELQAFANKTIDTNYTVSQSEVSQKQVVHAQEIIDKLSNLLSVFDLNVANKLLIDLYTIIPRRMKNVKDHLIKGYSTPGEIEYVNRLLSEEQNLLDTMAGQVALVSKQKEIDTKQKTSQGTILDTIGVEILPAEASDIETIKKMLGAEAGRFKQAFIVKNVLTESRFDNYVNNAKHKKTELFWHGSRNENWFNIIQSGLLIRPAGAVHTGSMFADGCYFADRAKKAIGYSSVNGSYWAKGSSNKGFVAIYNVHIGNQKHIYKHDSSCYSITKEKLSKENFDSVFAHGGYDLVNNEYVVYDISQSTIKYLVELS